MSSEASFSKLVPAAALSLLFGGAITALAGIQIVVFFEVWGSARFVPWIQLALGVGMAATASPVSLGRFRPALIGLSLSIVGGFVGAAWLLFALANTLVSPLLAIAPAADLLAALLLLPALPAVRRHEEARAALMAEREGWLGEPSRDSPWPATIGLLVSLLVASPLVLTAVAPSIADRLWLQLAALQLGVLPTAANVQAAEKVDFAYPWSPFAHYLQVESGIEPFDTALASAWADDLAVEVGLRLLSHTGTSDLSAAEVALWEQGQQEELPRWIARGLRDRGAFYHQESLLRRSFDPTRHRPGQEQHLDCDQLVYVFTHVAERLDLDMRPVPAVSHVYLHYRAPAGAAGETVVVETTEFRTIEVERDRINYAGEGLGDDFIVPADWHRSGKGGTWASASLTQAARLYEPAEPDDVHDFITSEIALGLRREDPARDVRPLLEAELPGTHDYALVSNLHGLYVDAAREAAKAGDVERALAEGRKAMEVRAAFPDLVSLNDRVERVPMIEALLGAGRKEEAAVGLREVLKVYRDELGVSDVWSPATRTHRRLLELSEEAGLRPGSAL